jgi:hypothetical protein
MAAQTSIERIILSGSTYGRMIKVAATSTPGTTIHTATSSTTDTLDEIWLWAVNSDTTDRKLTIEYGGVAAPDDLIEITIPAESGFTQVVSGLVLQNTLVVKAFASSANVVMVGGYVNRISP